MTFIRCNPENAPALSKRFGGSKEDVKERRVDRRGMEVGNEKGRSLSRSVMRRHSERGAFQETPNQGRVRACKQNHKTMAERDRGSGVLDIFDAIISSGHFGKQNVSDHFLSCQKF
jgi:hypothetical protein